METVVSLPATKYAAWLTTSGITGFTLPGIMDEPFCFGGKLISPIPVRGPELMSLKSFEIFDRLRPKVLRALDKAESTSKFCVPSTKSSAW